MAEGQDQDRGNSDPVLDAALTELDAEGLLDDSSGEPASPPSDAGAGAGEPSGVPDASATAEPVAVAPSGEPPAAETATAPTDGQPPAVDPLQDTAPLDYALDGQARAFDGVLVDKTNGGAFILPDKLDAVRARLADGDRAQGQVRQLYERVQHYERLGGVDGYAAMKAQAEANSAAGMFLLKTLAEAFPGPEHAPALKAVFERAEFLMQKAQFDTSRAFLQQFTQQQQTDQQQVVQQQAEGERFTTALAQIARALPALTPEDMKSGQQVFEEFKDVLYRHATPQDAQAYGVRVGERIFDPTKMNAWFTERAQWRTQDAKQRAAAQQATRFNAAQDRGRQGRPATGKPPARAGNGTPPPPNAKKAKIDTWADTFEAASTELGITD